MLEIKEMWKVFPGVKALNNVSVNFHEGEIHAVLGENGAGKSTLMKIICDMLKPDEGELYLNKEILRLNSFEEALSKKITLVSQEIQVLNLSTIAENIMLGKFITFGKTGIVNWRRTNEIAKKYLNSVGLDLPPTIIMGKLRTTQKKMIQIVKALALKPKILLLDEPTATSTEEESKPSKGLDKKI